MTAPLVILSPLSEAEFRQRAGDLMSHVEATLDAWLESGLVDMDSQRSGGMLELICPNDSRLVINWQPPLKEVWLAARSGGYHFRWGVLDAQPQALPQWRDTRSGDSFWEILSRSATEQCGTALEFLPLDKP